MIDIGGLKGENGEHCDHPDRGEVMPAETFGAIDVAEIDGEADAMISANSIMRTVPASTMGE